jgi:hypothetical protein
MDNNIDAKEVPPTNIPPVSSSPSVTSSDVVDIISQYLNNTLELEYEERLNIDRGSVKDISSTLSLHRLVRSLNILILDYVNTVTPDKTTQQSIILTEYFQGVNSLSKILDNIDIKVADNRIICYILGYMIKTLTKFKNTDNNEQE